jgi:hypothetical protein
LIALRFGCIGAVNLLLDETTLAGFSLTRSIARVGLATLLSFRLALLAGGFVFWRLAPLSVER